MVKANVLMSGRTTKLGAREGSCCFRYADWRYGQYAENRECSSPEEIKGRMAEWSKALALGASSKERGFEPHFCQYSVSVVLCRPIVA